MVSAGILDAALVELTSEAGETSVADGKRLLESFEIYLECVTVILLYPLDVVQINNGVSMNPYERIKR